MSKTAIYADRQTEVLADFVETVMSEANKGNALDSASSVSEFSKTRVQDSELPADIKKLVDELPEGYKHRALDGVITGCKIYKRNHGQLPTADLVRSSLHQAFTVTENGRKMAGLGRALDDVGNTDHHDPLSAQPNRAVIAITTAISEGIPFATYLPADIGSNESRLVIVSHQSGSTLGDYASGDLLDGINSGNALVAAERRVTATLNLARTTATAKINAVNGVDADVIVLRGRTEVLVNGLVAAGESTFDNASPTSPIAGTAYIANTPYTISGTVTIATGAVALAFSPALPVDTIVDVEGYIDFEAQPSLASRIIADARTFKLYAAPWRSIVRQTIDSKTQYANEIGVDLSAEALISLRAQVGNERHYMALAKAKAIGAANNLETYDFDASAQLQQKTRAQVLKDMFATVGVVDQRMANYTMDHGITHLYVGDKLAPQLISMGSEDFKPSGIFARPGIYWLGTLFGRYEVYYTPKLIVETSTTTQIIAVGRSSQVARCPIVLGDAVAPTYMQLLAGDDMKSGTGFYARNFTKVNPHRQSALGCALINVTNLF